MGLTPWALRRVRATHGEVDVALAAVSAVELTHGIYRARTDADRQRRRVFVQGVFHGLIVHPLTLEIAQLAGRIEGGQAAPGKYSCLPRSLDRSNSLASRLRCGDPQREAL